MTILSRIATGLGASGTFVVGIFYAAGAVTYAEPMTNQRVMLVNAQTGKYLTIAGGRSTENNVTDLQFTCDGDPSRTWRITQAAGGGYQISNVQTGKCLTIAGGRSTDNNVMAFQFNCDSDRSRTWRIPAPQRID